MVSKNILQFCELNQCFGISVPVNAMSMIMCCLHTPFLSESVTFDNGLRISPCSLFFPPTHSPKPNQDGHAVNQQWTFGGDQAQTHRIIKVKIIGWWWPDTNSQDILSESLSFSLCDTKKSKDGLPSLLIRTADVYGSRVCQEPGNKRFYGLDHSRLSSEISWSPTPHPPYNLQTVPEA